MINLKFVLLAYLFGPVIAVPYGLKYLNLSFIELFLYLSALHLLALPLIFKALESGRYKKVYKTRLVKKICQFSRIKAEEEVKRVEKSGNELVNYFQKKLGHLGFYLAISLFTILFGIFWATIFSYWLKVKRKRALLAIVVGVLLGNLLWVSLIFYSLPLLKAEMIILLIIAYLLIYGRQREITIIKNLGKRFRGLS